MVCVSFGGVRPVPKIVLAPPPSARVLVQKLFLNFVNPALSSCLNAQAVEKESRAMNVRLSTSGFCRRDIF